MASVARWAAYLFQAAFLLTVVRGFREGDPLAVFRPFRAGTGPLFELAKEYAFWVACVWICVGILSPIISKLFGESRRES